MDEEILEALKEVRKEMSKFTIEKILSPNYSKRTSDIDTIIIHYTGANRISSTIYWFQDKKSKVSAHYVIGRDGRIVQMVDDENKAWHAGASYFRGKQNVNNFSIGIELVGTKDSGFTDDQYEACAFVCSQLVEKYKIDLDRIVGHEDISGDEAVKLGIRTENNKKIDPGSEWKWKKFHQELSALLNKSIADEEPKVKDDTDNNDNLYSQDSMMESGIDPKSDNVLKQILLGILRLFGIRV